MLSLMIDVMYRHPWYIYTDTNLHGKITSRSREQFIRKKTTNEALILTLSNSAVWDSGYDYDDQRYNTVV